MLWRDMYRPSCMLGMSENPRFLRRKGKVKEQPCRGAPHHRQGFEEVGGSSVNLERIPKSTPGLDTTLHPSSSTYQGYQGPGMGWAFSLE